MRKAWEWLKAHWWVVPAALGALFGFGWLWGSRGLSGATTAAEEVGEARGKTMELEKAVKIELEVARRAAESRAESAEELEAVRASIRKVEAESGAKSATEIANAFNRRAKERDQ